MEPDRAAALSRAWTGLHVTVEPPSPDATQAVREALALVPDPEAGAAITGPDGRPRSRAGNVGAPCDVTLTSRVAEFNDPDGLERELAHIQQRVRRARQPLSGADKIGRAVGAVLGTQSSVAHRAAVFSRRSLILAALPRSSRR